MSLPNPEFDVSGSSAETCAARRRGSTQPSVESCKCKEEQPVRCCEPDNPKPGQVGCARNTFTCRRQDPQGVDEPDEKAENEATDPGRAERPRFAGQRIDDPHQQPHAQVKDSLNAGRGRSLLDLRRQDSA